MPPLAVLPTAASAARAHVRSTLTTWGMDHLADAAEAIVSELVANAVNASSDDRGQPAYRDGRILLLCVRLHADGARLRAEVWDQAPGVPARKEVGPDSESGRGLALVGDLASAWGWHPARRQQGKCVWAEIPAATTIPGHRGANGNAG